LEITCDCLFDWFAGVKQINDSYGHLVGDAVLREASKRLLGSVRTYDFIGRYGGEEFLIIMPSCNPSDLKAGAERLRHAIANQPVKTSAGPIVSTISIGVASAPVADEGTSEFEALLKVSDEALYRAKDKGRNRVEIALATLSAAAGALVKSF